MKWIGSPAATDTSAGSKLILRHNPSVRLLPRRAVQETWWLKGEKELHVFT